MGLGTRCYVKNFEGFLARPTRKLSVCDDDLLLGYTMLIDKFNHSKQILINEFLLSSEVLKVEDFSDGRQEKTRYSRKNLSPLLPSTSMTSVVEYQYWIYKSDQV